MVYDPKADAWDSLTLAIDTLHDREVLRRECENAPEPYVERWPRWQRRAFIVSASLTLWFLIIAGMIKVIGWAS